MSALGASSLCSGVLNCGDDQSDLEPIFHLWRDEVLRQLLPELGVTADSAQDALLRVQQEPYSRKQKKAVALWKKVQQWLNAPGTTTTPLANASSKVKRPKFKPSIPSNSISVSNAPAVPPKEQAGCGDSNCACAAAEEETEEDRINNAFITMDQIPETAATASSTAKRVKAKHVKSQGGAKKSSSATVDLEDLVANPSAAPASSEETTAAGPCCGGTEEDTEDEEEDPEEALHPVNTSTNAMVTNLQRKALTKEGYKIIGTHSAVKVCRWTKNQMRGRGGCYKHSFYGITRFVSLCLNRIACDVTV